MPSKIVVFAGLAMACVAGFAHSETPHGRPHGMSAATPTGLRMRTERTMLTFLRDSARVVYRSRASFVNPGSRRRIELHADFIGATGSYRDEQPALVWGEPHGAPTFVVKVDDRVVATRCDTVGDLFRFRWQLAAPRRGLVELELEATFPWLPDVCAAPDHTLDWRPADDAVFDVSGAAREMCFRFVPAVSLMAVDSQTDGGEFERGTVTWRWQGRHPGAFDLTFDADYADEYPELFSGRYSLPLDRGLDNSYFEISSRNCEEDELSMDAGRDSLSAEARAWVEDARTACRSVIATLSQLHGLAPLDTASSAPAPPLEQEGLRDHSLSALSPVERRNLRYAVSLLWALDPTRNSEQVIARMSEARAVR